VRLLGGSGFGGPGAALRILCGPSSERGGLPADHLGGTSAVDCLRVAHDAQCGDMAKRALGGVARATALAQIAPTRS